MNPVVLQISMEESDLLRRHLTSLSEVSPFRDHPKLSARIASYGIFREVGTVNDELARFIFDSETQQPVQRESLRAEMIQWKDLFGVHIFSTQSQRLDLRTKGFFDVVHPRLSANADGSFHSLYIFPEIIAEITAREGVELVMVKSWGMNSIFGGFDPRKGYYQTNLWEIENNDVVRFADLTRQGQIAFMGTHDLLAHIAGVDRGSWDELKKTAQRVYEGVQSYFHQTEKPSVSALILPYTIGVVLDDLAQPPTYSSKGHLAVLNELLFQMDRKVIPPDMKTMLTQFPPSFQNIIELSRVRGIESQPGKIKASIQAMTREILNASMVSIA